MKQKKSKKYYINFYSNKLVIKDRDNRETWELKLTDKKSKDDYEVMKQEVIKCLFR